MSLDVRALRSHLAGPFSFSVARGQCLAISGASGSGKSVLLRLLADLDPSEGSVSLDGEDRAAMSGVDWRRRVGLVPARSGWWAERVDEHFAAAQASARDALASELFLPSRLFSRPVDEASTGERQRLALVRALLAQPRVLLLDEPTSSLDPLATLAVETLLRRRMAEGLTVVMVTHDASQAERCAEQILHMRDGVLERL